MKEAKRKTVANGRKAANVVPFEQDAGFYLQKGMFYYQKNRSDKAIRFFRKAVSVDPKNPFTHYNLACVLSKLGRLKEANKIFLHIVSELDGMMADCYFLLAINYGLLEDLGKSREYLMRYLQEAPEGEMSSEAMELLTSIDEDFTFTGLSAYSERDLALEKVLQAGRTEDLNRLYSSNLGFRKALNNRLYHGSDQFKEDIIRFYGALNAQGAQKALRDFVKNPWIKERFRQLALLELKGTEDSNKVQIFINGARQEMDLENYPIKKPAWRKEWQQVIDCAMKNMRKSDCYAEGFFDDVQAIWSDFINTVYPQTPRIVKTATWAAALEYSLARFHFLDLTQRELAEEYGVSVTSISEKYKKINAALQIDEKGHRNMLEYLKSEYD
ncbi:MAG: tetratricopeptide repeat protein [Dethiobacter sp.]|jgi:tetratricopeptide (TPR) repeat protein|nr:tetratricopeptide repeat protein [Dethiobacter sp.]MCL4463171.1 tetratricopeptide repeat protein [Bacillota bacterium]MCL5992925.1 tetratricopeptide repeat protein [Bacillota bacterium]